MLTTLETILADARRRKYAVPAFDCVEDIMVRTILDTSEDEQSPVILSCLAPDLEGRGWAYLPGLIKAVAGSYSIPVALHLDHADNLGLIKRAVEEGFTSVMIDGSSLPFAENATLTRQAVEIAQPKRVSVEGELGHVGGMDLEATCASESVLTEPAELARFVAQTGIDALAVSIGTAHGVYQSLPTLHIGRLQELNEASTVPLVLHGGSGTPEDQMRQALACGICKVNIYADCRIAMYEGFKRSAAMKHRCDPLPSDLFGPVREALAQSVREKIALLGSAGKAGGRQ